MAMLWQEHHRCDTTACLHCSICQTLCAVKASSHPVVYPTSERSSKSCMTAESSYLQCAEWHLGSQLPGDWQYSKQTSPGLQDKQCSFESREGSSQAADA